MELKTFIEKAKEVGIKELVWTKDGAVALIELLRTDGTSDMITKLGNQEPFTFMDVQHIKR